MATQGDRASKLIRTTVLVPEETHSALHELARSGQRPLSWEIRRALEEHVQRETERDLTKEAA